MKYASLAPLIVLGVAATPKAAPPAVDFARDIQPILKAKCVSCHGGSQRQGNLSFDRRADAARVLAKGGSLVARLKGLGGKPQMPLGFSPLNDAQIAQFQQWVSAGSPWRESARPVHWAYSPLRRPLEPPVDVSGVDAFITAKLQRSGLTLSPEADRVTLIRRVTLDLIGLPPTPAEVDAFLADRKPGAYERVVDRLLANPHYGEKMALPWLDAARYADSNGFQQDGDTYQYVWRDWVVKALNRNMPFDTFTIEQLAGDLLPGATLEQRIATGFNRCHLLNGEGGAIPEEQRNVILFDRVDVTATTWLGVTMACAQCHDHKYDPISQKDYYKFLAYFNNVPETGVPPGGGQYRIADPFVLAPDAAQTRRLAELDAAIATAKASPLAGEAGVTLGPWRALGPVAADSFDAAFEREPAPKGEAIAHPEWADGAVQTLALPDNAAIYLSRTITADRARTIPISLGSDDGVKVWLNGAPLLSNKVTRGVAADQESVQLPLTAGANELTLKIVNGGGAAGFYFRAGGDSALAKLQKERDDLNASLPKVMVMSDARPRATHVLSRGNYEAPLDAVTAGTPAVFPAGVSGNRLDLARWLVGPDNPLTARVQVNRYWQLFFGRGLVKTSENFGVQAEPPTHPALLDWLASEFVQSGWDVKRLHRMIVTSATYRQSSKVTPALLKRDPENALLTRGPRYRLPSLLLRDVALAASGLLDDRIGGKPVYPYQPPGIWDSLAITKERDFSYPQSTGRDLYRRSLYTFWRRTVGPGNMFDASTRQACKVRASVTSTPLHALTTLNDITWIEAGRALAQRVMQASPSPEARLADAFRRVCARRPDATELAVLKRSLARAQAYYKNNPKAAEAVLKIGESPCDTKLGPVEHAAYATVCHAIFNLDEALTKE